MSDQVSRVRRHVSGVAVVIDSVTPIAIFRAMEEAKVILAYWAKSDDVLFEGADLSLVDLASGEQLEFFNDSFNDAEPFIPELLDLVRQRAAETFQAKGE